MLLPKNVSWFQPPPPRSHYPRQSPLSGNYKALSLRSFNSRLARRERHFSNFLFFFHPPGHLHFSRKSNFSILSEKRSYEEEMLRLRGVFLLQGRVPVITGWKEGVIRRTRKIISLTLRQRVCIHTRRDRLSFLYLVSGVSFRRSKNNLPQKD